MQHITIVDPGTIDGTPYEAAYGGTQQAASLAKILTEQIHLSETQAKNAEMSRRLRAEPNKRLDISDWENTAQGRKYIELSVAVELVAQELETLAKAAGYDPDAVSP